MNPILASSRIGKQVHAHMFAPSFVLALLCCLPEALYYLKSERKIIFRQTGLIFAQQGGYMDVRASKADIRRRTLACWRRLLENDLWRRLMLEI